MKQLPTFLSSITLLALPFVFLNQTLDPTLLPRFLALTVLLALITTIVLARGGTPEHFASIAIGHRALVLAWCGYLLFAVISVTQAGNVAEAVFELLKSCLAVIAFLVFASILWSDRNAIGCFCRSIALAAGGISAIGLCQYYSVVFESLPPNAIATNRNFLASSLCLMFPFVLYVVLRSGPIWRKAASLAAALSVAMILLCNTRAVWVAMVAATIVTVTIYVRSPRHIRLSPAQKNSYRKRVLGIVALISAVAIVFSSPYVRPNDSQNMVDQVAAILQVDEGSVGQRLALWRKSLEMFVDCPLLGIGPGNWKLVVPKYGIEGLHSETGEIIYQRPHNDYLWILTESGVFALACYLAIFAAAFFLCVRVVLRNVESEDFIVALLMVFGLTTFLILSFFSFPKERVLHSMLMSLMLAFVTVAHARAFPATKRWPSGRGLSLVMMVACLACLALGLLTGHGRLKAEIHTKRAIAARAMADWGTVITEIDQALSPFAQLDPTSTPLMWYRGVANFSLDRLDEAFADFSEAYRVNSHHLHVLNNLATCVERKGDHQQAIKYYQEALRLSPSFEETLLNLTATYYNSGQYAEALGTLQQIKTPGADARYRRYLDKTQRKLEPSR